MPVPIRIVQDSIVIAVGVNGMVIDCILDTGDAVGPVFTAADANRLGLVQGQAFGVSGAGGESTSYQTVATISLDGRTWPAEPSAIDTQLDGMSLIGMPFFLRETLWLMLDLRGGQLYFAA